MFYQIKLRWVNRLFDLVYTNEDTNSNEDAIKDLKLEDIICKDV